ncbi:hypothetical protein Tco_0662304 [Tanacetum coccineum]
MSKQRFASQVDVNKNLLKPVTQHYLPKNTESACTKPDHMIASSSSRNSSKNMPRFSSNDMVHNHYLDVAKKKIQERDRNSTTSVTTSARFKALLMVANQNLGATIKHLGVCLSLTGHRFSPNKTSAVYEKTSPDLIFSGNPHVNFRNLLVLKVDSYRNVNSTLHKARSTSIEHSFNTSNSNSSINCHSKDPAPENIIQAETNTENAQFDEDEFINIFSTPVQEQGETSSRHVDSSNMHTFYQHHPLLHNVGQKDHPLEQVM